jgi:glycosyltransferase involved in cell wall biosynthesis
VPVVSLHNCDVELGAGPCNRVLTTALRASVRYQMLRSDAVVSYSAEYANSRPLPPRVRRVLRIIPPAIAPPPVDGTAQSRFAAAKGARCWVGACGRVSREKGLDRLAMAHGALTTPDVELVFAGPCGPEVVGEQDCFASLRERLRSRAVPHRFLGTLEHAALGAFYHAIDCLVLPSTNCTESFGLVQVEAMHCGTPVVAADLPGVSVPVARTGLGRLFPPGDVAALARAIDAVLANPRPAPGTAAAALRAFAPEVVCAEWDRLAAELTAGPAGRDRR